jgi:hypothetical protein
MIFLAVLCDNWFGDGLPDGAGSRRPIGGGAHCHQKKKR